MIVVSGKSEITINDWLAYKCTKSYLKFVIEANTWVVEPYQVLLINGLSTKLLLSNGSS